MKQHIDHLNKAIEVLRDYQVTPDELDALIEEMLVLFGLEESETLQYLAKIFDNPQLVPYPEIAHKEEKAIFEYLSDFLNVDLEDKDLKHFTQGVCQGLGLNAEECEALGGIFNLINNVSCKQIEELGEMHDYQDDENRLSLENSEQLVDEAFQYLYSMGIDQKSLSQTMDLFYSKYPEEDFTTAVLKHKKIKPFAAGGNIFEDSNGIDEPTLFVMRWLAGIKMTQVLEVLKFDLNDSNLVQDLEVGNIGTAQRWAKTITGSNLEDDSEMMSGRYTTKPRLATFPNTEMRNNVPITKRVDLSSVCSHHFLPYGTLLKEDSFAIISYIPKDYVLGISKLQRLADWAARRPTIQEDLCKNLWKEITEAAQTDDVYVGIYNARHTCEYLRGSQSHDGSFTTEYYDGAFNDADLRASVISTSR